MLLLIIRKILITQFNIYLSDDRKYLLWVSEPVPTKLTLITKRITYVPLHQEKYIYRGNPALILIHLILLWSRNIPK